jgi:thymidylate kinase
MERGWWDLVVDPARYRLNAPPAWIHLLGRLLPRPDRTIVLTGNAEVILARKAELSPDELARQLDAWRALPTARLRAVAIDATMPLETVVPRAHAVIRDLRR